MQRNLWHWTALVVAFLALPVPTRADHPSIGFGPGVAGPIVTVSADTLPAGHWTAGVRVEHGEFEALSDDKLKRLAAQGEDVHSVDAMTSIFVGGAYGVTDRLTVGAHIPYVVRENIREGHEEDGEPEVHDHGDSTGIGDVTVLGQYRFAGGSGGKWAAAAVLGVKAPTGETDEEDSDGQRFETEHQPGSGSWDTLFGLAANAHWELLSADASVLYTLATEGSQQTDLGDLLSYNLALSHRLERVMHDHPAGAHQGGQHEHLALDLVLELNGEWRQKQSIDGESDDNSGGHTLFLSPGARLTVNETVAGFLSVGFPIAQDLEGHQHRTDFRVILGVAAGF